LAVGNTEAAWQDSGLASYWLWPHHHPSHRQETSQEKKIRPFCSFQEFLLEYFIFKIVLVHNVPSVHGAENGP
jgi:hypothetical protein